MDTQINVPLDDYKVSTRAAMMLDFLMTYLDQCQEETGVTAYDPKVIRAIETAYYG